VPGDEGRGIGDDARDPGGEDDVGGAAFASEDFGDLEGDLGSLVTGPSEKALFVIVRIIGVDGRIVVDREVGFSVEFRLGVLETAVSESGEDGIGGAVTMCQEQVGVVAVELADGGLEFDGVGVEGAVFVDELMGDAVDPGGTEVLGPCGRAKENCEDWKGSQEGQARHGVCSSYRVVLSIKRTRPPGRKIDESTSNSIPLQPFVKRYLGALPCKGANRCRVDRRTRQG